MLRDIQKARRQNLSSYELSRNIVRCVMIDVEGRGSPQVGNRAGFVWVREYDSDAGVFQAFSPTVQPRTGLVVLVATDPKPPYRRMVIGVDWGALLDAGNYTPGDPFYPNHGSSHEMREGAIGSDPVYVYLRALTPLRVSPYAGLFVIVNAGMYIYQNVVRFLYVQLIDLSGSVPGAGLARNVLIYVNPVSNTLLTLNGSTTTIGDPVSYPNPPDISIPLAWVYLQNGDTVVTEADIVDARPLFTVGEDIQYPEYPPVIDIDGKIVYDVDGNPVFIDDPEYWYSPDSVPWGAMQPMVNLHKEVVTIASGAITVSSSYVKVNGEGNVADDLETINGGTDGDLIILSGNDNGTITVKSTGNIRTVSYRTLAGHLDKLMLLYDGDASLWLEISYADNP